MTSFRRGLLSLWPMLLLSAMFFGTALVRAWIVGHSLRTALVPAFVGSALIFILLVSILILTRKNSDD